MRPFSPQQQTSLGSVGTSAKCHEQTGALLMTSNR